MPYTERETGSFAGSLAMGFVLAIAGAIVYALIFIIMKAVMGGRLAPWMSLVLAVFGCVVIGSLVGGGIRGGGGTRGGILNRIVAVLLAYAGIAVGMTAVAHDPSTVFRQSIAKTIEAPIANADVKTIAIMALGLLFAFFFAAGAEPKSKGAAIKVSKAGE